MNHQKIDFWSDWTRWRFYMALMILGFIFFAFFLDGVSEGNLSKIAMGALGSFIIFLPNINRKVVKYNRFLIFVFIFDFTFIYFTSLFFDSIHFFFSIILAVVTSIYIMRLNNKLIVRER